MKEDLRFSNFWKACWKDVSWPWRILLIVFTPYLWVCYGLAMSGYSSEEKGKK